MTKKTIKDYKKENKELRAMVKKLVMKINGISPSYWRDYFDDDEVEKIVKMVPYFKEY